MLTSFRVDSPLRGSLTVESTVIFSSGDTQFSLPPLSRPVVAFETDWNHCGAPLSPDQQAFHSLAAESLDRDFGTLAGAIVEHRAWNGARCSRSAPRGHLRLRSLHRLLVRDLADGIQRVLHARDGIGNLGNNRRTLRGLAGSPRGPRHGLLSPSPASRIAIELPGRPRVGDVGTIRQCLNYREGLFRGKRGSGDHWAA